jgi:hypothetical protein
MKYGLRKSLEDIAFELKGIKNILGSMWHSRYSNGEIDTLNPEAYADEYISTEECGKRLGVSDQTIRNWIAIGRRDPNKGWKEGIHFVNVSPDPNRKAVLRVPWNQLVQSFSKNRDLESRDLRGKGDAATRMYNTDREFLE